MIRLYSALAVLFVASATLPAATYWVATNGDDSNNGTSSNTPFATPQHAVTLSGLTGGDTIYFRGGTYAMNTQVKPSRAGTAGNHLKIWAYPGELPVFDFATMSAGSTKALDLRKEYIHVKGIEVKNAPDSGIFVGANGIIVEGCITHDCGNDGIILGSTTIRATNALILNCDSYRNYGGGDGNNGDGFAAKTGCGPGNIFRGCRSWNNADDGWDFYDNITNSVLLQGCWSFSNGYNVFGYGGTWNGNGNGFKLGGAGTQAKHFLTNCVAFGNRRKGFDHNNSSAGQTMVNCTSYSNNTVNFSFYDTPTAGSPLPNLLINNVAYAGVTADTSLDATAVQISNSWQIAAVTAADFASLDISLALAPRNPDYSLPTNNLFRLVAGSDLIDRGRNVSLPFTGPGPDLGAFEFSAVTSSQGPIWFDVGPNSLKVTNGGFNLRVNGLTAHGPVVLYASSNTANWTAIQTNPAATGATQFVDSNIDSSVRFYRAEEK
jgi:hypothetical protein